MLEKGEIDGVFSARAPSCFLRGAPNVGRLFPDYPAVEEAYFKKTKLFPIMHAIGIRRSLVEKYPWVAVNVYKAFLKAKALCMARACRNRASACRPCRGRCMPTIMPARSWARTTGLMARTRTSTPLETLARYSFEQGLSVRQVPLDEMFAKPTYELTKI